MFLFMFGGLTGTARSQAVRLTSMTFGAKMEKVEASGWAHGEYA